MTAPAKRRPLFDIIENPEKGWVCNRIQRVTSIAGDDEAQWQVEISRESDGHVLVAEAAMLMIAWARVTERAHMLDSDL